MVHLTVVTKRSSMTQWPIQRNIYTLIPQNNSMNKFNSSETATTTTTHILTTHNCNTPRLSPTINQHPPAQQQQQSASSSISSSASTYDDSLTNLSWLHDINILKRTMPTMSSSTSTSSSNSNHKRKEPSSYSDRTVYPNDISDNHDLIINNDDNDDQWKMYKSNPEAKPIYSYSQLIFLAMKESGYEKMTLQMIYEWIAENFPYFKKMEPTWQNSIRYNLSLNKSFIKVPRTKKESGTGKGGFWKLSSEYKKINSISSNSSSELDLPQPKRHRHSKRSTEIFSKSSHENQKLESWIDPIFSCPTTSKSQSPLRCHTTIPDRSYIRMPSSFLSPTSSPDSLTVSPFNHQPIHDFSSILTPSPSTSPSSVISKQNLPNTKLDDTDMLLLDSSAFDWDAYLYETPTDIDLSSKADQDLFNEFNAALTDLTTSAETAAAVVGAGADPNTFDAFDYSSKPSTFHCLFEDDEQPSISSEFTNTSTDLTIKGCGIKRPTWWNTNESITSTKLPSLETAFDLKFSKQ